jgi:hypothetical protein
MRGEEGSKIPHKLNFCFLPNWRDLEGRGFLDFIKLTKLSSLYFKIPILSLLQFLLLGFCCLELHPYFLYSLSASSNLLARVHAYIACLCAYLFISFNFLCDTTIYVACTCFYFLLILLCVYEAYILSVNCFCAYMNLIYS